MCVRQIHVICIDSRSDTANRVPRRCFYGLITHVRHLRYRAIAPGEMAQRGNRHARHLWGLKARMRFRGAVHIAGPIREAAKFDVIVNPVNK